MKNKITNFITISLIAGFLLPVQTGCKKWRKNHYETWIVGAWCSTQCVDHIAVPGCVDYIDIYLSNGTWYSIEQRFFNGWDSDGLYLTFNNVDCMPLFQENKRMDFISTWGFDPISDTLSYRIEGDNLIRMHHEEIYDKSTPIVPETLLIKRIRNCKFNKSFKMILNGEDYYKLIYKKSEERGCDTSPPCL